MEKRASAVFRIIALAFLLLPVLLLMSCGGSTSDEISRPSQEPKKPGLEYLGEISFDDISDYMEEQDLDLEDPEQLREAIGLFLEQLIQRGISNVFVDVFDRDGYLYMSSQALQEAGFRLSEMGDVFAILVSLAAENDVVLNVCLEDWAQIIYGYKDYSDQIKADLLDKERLSLLLEEIAQYKQDSGDSLAVNEEAFTVDWVALIDTRTRELGLEYYHYFYSPEGYADTWLTESYAVYPYDVVGEEKDLRYLESIMEWEYFFHLGQDDYLFALANAQNKDSGCVTAAGWGLYEIMDTDEQEEGVYPPSLSGFMQNVALFYAVREPTLRSLGFILASHDMEDPRTGLFHDPDEYDYIQGYDYLSTFEPLFKELGWRETDDPLPTANLVVMEPSSHEALELFEEHLQAVLPTVTNALYCAGYRPFATTGGFLPQADLYYVFAPGWLDDGARGDLDGKVLEITNTGKRCFLHPLGLLSATETPSWMDFMSETFGVTDSEGLEAEGEGSPIPVSVEWSFDGEVRDIKLRGLGLFEELGELSQGWEHLINHLDLDGDTEVVLTVDSIMAEGREIPLILKKGDCYLMNLGNRLHLEFSNILANIFAGQEIIHQPGFFHASLTPSRSALLVLRDGWCDITLPQSGTVVEFDRQGRRLDEANLELEGNRLQGQLKRWHLIVIFMNS